MLDILHDDIRFYMITFLNHDDIMKLILNKYLHFYFEDIFNWKIYFFNCIILKNNRNNTLFTNQYCRKHINSNNFTCLICCKYLAFNHYIILCDCIYNKVNNMDLNLRYCENCIYKIKKPPINNLNRYVGNILCPVCSKYAMYCSVTYAS